MRGRRWSESEVGDRSESEEGGDGGEEQRDRLKGIERERTLLPPGSLGAPHFVAATLPSCEASVLQGLGPPSMRPAPWAFWKTTRRSTPSLWTFASSSPATSSCCWSSWYRVSCTTAGEKIPPRSTPRTRSPPSLPSGWWWCRALQPRWDGGTRPTWSQPTTSQRIQTSGRRKAQWSERDSGDFVYTSLFFCTLNCFYIFCCFSGTMLQVDLHRCRLGR